MLVKWTQTGCYSLEVLMAIMLNAILSIHTLWQRGWLASEIGGEKLDADVWYSLFRSCHFFFFLPSISPAPFPPISCHFWQLQRTIRLYRNEAAPSFSNPILSHPSRVKYASNPTIKSVCSQHGHAIGRTIMETEIYGQDQVCVWGIVPDIIGFFCSSKDRGVLKVRGVMALTCQDETLTTSSGIINVIVIFFDKNKRSLASTMEEQRDYFFQLF